MKIQRITSARNEKVKRWRKLSTRKGREEHGCLLIEGEKLLQEAIRAGWSIRSILVSEEGTPLLKPFAGSDVPVYSLYASTFAQLVDTQSPPGIAAELAIPDERDFPAPEGVVLLLDALQDPGNLGSILRTAEAAGVKDLWLGDGTVDPHNPKVVRSAMGSLFRSRIRRGPLKEAIGELKRRGYQVLATSPRAEKAHFDMVYPEKTAFLLGNEGNGLSHAVEVLADEQIRIPMPGEVESLNVSVTAGILLFERVRQKRAAFR